MLIYTPFWVLINDFKEISYAFISKIDHVSKKGILISK